MRAYRSVVAVLVLILSACSSLEFQVSSDVSPEVVQWTTERAMAVADSAFNCDNDHQPTSSYDGSVWVDGQQVGQSAKVKWQCQPQAHQSED